MAVELEYNVQVCHRVCKYILFQTYWDLPQFSNVLGSTSIFIYIIMDEISQKGSYRFWKGHTYVFEWGVYSGREGQILGASLIVVEWEWVYSGRRGRFWECRMLLWKRRGGTFLEEGVDSGRIAYICRKRG